MHTSVVSILRDLVVLEIYFRKKNNFSIQISAELKKKIEQTLTVEILFVYLMMRGFFFQKNKLKAFKI